MDYRVIVSKDAHDDIDEALNYITNILKNPIAAKRLLDKIEEAYNDLSLNPYMYAACNDERLRREGYRKVVINNYILIYRVNDEDKAVYILRLFFGRRNYTEII